MTIGIETIAKGSRYRLQSHNQVMTLSAADCVELLELLYLKRDDFKSKDDEQEWDDATWHRALRETRLRDFTQERYQEFVDSLSAETREEIATWKEVIAEEREQAERARRYNLEMDARLARQLEARDKPWLPIQPGEEF